MTDDRARGTRYFDATGACVVGVPAAPARHNEARVSPRRSPPRRPVPVPLGNPPSPRSAPASAPARASLPPFVAPSAMLTVAPRVTLVRAPAGGARLPPARTGLVSAREPPLRRARAVLARAGDADRPLHAASDLAPPRASPALVASVSAKPAAPAPASDPSPFALWCRSNWPLFVVAQTLALVGAAASGVSSRKKRVELAALNEKLRKMKEARDAEDGTCSFDWSASHGQCTDSWPGAAELAVAKEALEKNGQPDEALVWFAAAKDAVRRDAGGGGEGIDFMYNLSGVAAASWLSAGKGTALALLEKGDETSLREAVRELKAVEALAASEGDSSVCGMIGDALTDLGDFAEAGAYYDKVLEMD